MNETERVVAEVLKENTGASMLDSGDAYGRHWERNQKRDFSTEPPAIINGGPGDWWCEINIYHFLTRALEYAPEMDKRFQEWAKQPENSERNWFELMVGFPEVYAEEQGKELGGLYGEDKPFTVNTYNRASLLSQVIQYHYFELDGKAFVLLQIHNGCDVRGGYTRPRAFRVFPEGDVSIFDDARCELTCPNGHGWYTDDAGSHWYPSSDEPPLENTGEPVCPLCGAKLEAWF